MPDISETQFFKVEQEKSITPSELLEKVFKANKEKGYDPINQITGYLVSDDPTYITSHNDARKIIRRLERDEIIEELLRAYAEQNGWM
ncbi:MAG: IreB family regulatory phosphoprotein [Lachnospiraceae bacterium]|nr:IreB family regulatory phosphoprotein [Lachnospiraceae bacterium]